MKSIQQRYYIFLTILILFISALALTSCIGHGDEKDSALHNVLFISIDDLNDWIEPLGGNNQVKTPNFNSLIERGMLFEHAYCASPLCNPSRTALMTGMAPYKSGIYYNSHNFRSTEILKDSLTIPQYFSKYGYYTAGAGKIFHNTWPDTISWDDYWPGKKNHMPADPKPVSDERLSWQPLAGHFDWEPLDVPVEEMGDMKSVNWISEQLAKSHEKPFFLACGIYRPHLPWYVPRRFFDLYPVEEIQLPEVIPDDLLDVPEFARGLAHGFGDIIDINTAPRSHPSDNEMIIKRNAQKEAIQGYLASISFADYCLGQLIAALDSSEYAKNTLVVLWSDHGYHLGEKEHWRKETLWEEATRNVFFIQAPGVTQNGSSTSWPVSLMDIFPTLIDLCDLPEKQGLDGNNLMELMKNPDMPWDKPVVTTYGYMNHSVRSKDFHYIRYRDGSEEFYDHRDDPNEWENCIHDHNYQSEIERLKKYLPTENAVPVPFHK